ncbi:hypothetical protein [Streptomyces acidiscabies]|uniref:Uncharacterized protein n=1 Tax=Streptomyces acidiscabies TaxID=42234 RepID=A0A0L0JKW8_9ACTN|nr:hypothetical protein [Streptomyces acidiscabies]KND26030.1 hypothetical protein IQ63_37940 [Streptomyces acidiscabies]
MSAEETTCRVCGQNDGTVLWSNGTPHYVICDCCGTESGIGDDNLSQARELRGFWVANGAPWDVPRNRPEDWNLLDQMKNLPPEWR